MITFAKNQHVVGFTFRYKHFVYHLRYMRSQKKFDAGRQYL